MALYIEFPAMRREGKTKKCAQREMAFDAFVIERTG